MAALSKLLNTKETAAGRTLVSVNVSNVIYDEMNDHLGMLIFHRRYQLSAQ